MSEERTKCKLSGILNADAVGYNRLMEEDEASTIRSIEESKMLMSKLIEQYKGRVVDAPGDNLPADFGSLTLSVLNLPVEKVDSIGLVVRICLQCSAGKS